MSSANETNRSYRRGAIMGLTMAEAFILIAFALLLLFFFLQRQANTEAMQAFRSLSEERRQAVGESILDGSLTAFLILRERGVDFSTPEEHERPEENWRFIAQDEVLRIVDGVSGLSPALQNEIADVFEREEARDLLDLAIILGEAELEERELDYILELVEEAEISVKQIIQTSEFKKEIDRRGTSIEELAEAAVDMEAQEQEGRFREEIADKIRAAAERQEELVAALQRELGDLVEEAGGRIDPSTGEIIFPGVLFEQGEASITRERRDFLNEFCEPWLNLLRLSSVNIYEVKIEGHASSEWNPDSGVREAYLGNLDLSQRRSQAVLRECMDLVNDPELLDWAMNHMIAVGYSSARTVSQNGQEDRIASRRVVFSATANRESLIEEIETEANKPQGDR